MRSGVHESRFFLSNFHASRSSFRPYHASRINPLPPSTYKSTKAEILNTFFKTMDYNNTAIIVIAYDIFWFGLRGIT